jgi:hypothetical protein
MGITTDLAVFTIVLHGSRRERPNDSPRRPAGDGDVERPAFDNGAGFRENSLN